MTQIVGEALAGWYKAKRQDGEFGVEIETEVIDSGVYPMDFLVEMGRDDNKAVTLFSTPSMPKWRAVTDNSLRNYGIEYIFKRPYVFKKANSAIEEFCRETGGVQFVKNAPGASVHVHVNMYNETFLTFGNFLTAYVLFENVFQEYAGPQRRSNLFSLPARCSEPVVWNIMKMFQGLEEGNHKSVIWGEDAVKYGALNIAPLTRLGSIEIRSMRGVTDEETLKTWLGVINRLLILSRTEGLTPRMVINEYRLKGLEFFQEVFGDFWEALVPVDTSLQVLIDRNLYYAGQITSSVKDWNSLGDKIEPKVKNVPEKKVINKVNAGQNLGIPVPQGDINWGDLANHVNGDWIEAIVQEPPMVEDEPEEEFEGDFEEDDYEDPEMHEEDEDMF